MVEICSGSIWGNWCEIDNNSCSQSATYTAFFSNLLLYDFIWILKIEQNILICLFLWKGHSHIDIVQAGPNIYVIGMVETEHIIWIELYNK